MAYVYRYIDNSDGIIKYIGIVWSGNRTLQQRIYEHQRNDNWCKLGDFTIEYIEENINSRTDAEFFEAHYISLYGTDKYFNVSKAGWGVSSFLPNRENDWVKYDSQSFIEKDTDYIFRVCWTKDEDFDVKMMPAIKRKCKKKKDVCNEHCKCGSDNLYKKDNGKCGQLYCRECGSWVAQGNRDTSKYYTPNYSGRYVIEDGKVATYEYVTICFGRKDCWHSYEKSVLERVTSNQPIGVFSGGKNNLTWIHTYAMTYDEVEDAKNRILQYIKNEKQLKILSVENEIKDIKKKLKELPKLLESSKDDYDRFLDKYNGILAIES